MVGSGRDRFRDGSLGVQMGRRRDQYCSPVDGQIASAEFLSDQLAIGSDAAADREIGKSAHGDRNAQILFRGSTNGAFAGLGLDGSTIKSDESRDKALYGKQSRTGDRKQGNADTGNC